MTTLIPFVTSSTSVPPFSTPLTLDNASYVGNVTWNVYGQRWYLNILDISGNSVWCGAMVGSSLTNNVYLAQEVFSTSTILFREDTGNIEVNP